MIHDIYEVPNINGKDGRSIGLSGAPTITKVPFTFNSSRVGPTECLAETVSNIKSSLLFFDCSHSKNSHMLTNSKQNN